MLHISASFLRNDEISKTVHRTKWNHIENLIRNIIRNIYCELIKYLMVKSKPITSSSLKFFI